MSILNRFRHAGVIRFNIILGFYFFKRFSFNYPYKKPLKITDLFLKTLYDLLINNNHPLDYCYNVSLFVYIVDL